MHRGGEAGFLFGQALQEFQGKLPLLGYGPEGRQEALGMEAALQLGEQGALIRPEAQAGLFQLP